MLHLGLAGYIQHSDTRGLGAQLDRPSYLQWSLGNAGLAGAQGQSLQHVLKTILYLALRKTVVSKTCEYLGIQLA